MKKQLYYLALSVSSGVLLGLGWPGTGDISALLFIGLAPLLLLEHNFYTKKKSIFQLFLFAQPAFILWNTIATWWIINATVTGMIVAIIGNSLFMSMVFLLFHFVKKKLTPSAGYAALIFLWIGWEYLHTQWVLSWPWLTLGNGFANNIHWIQWYEYTGVLGGTLWIMAANIIFFFILKELLSRRILSKMGFPVISLMAIIAIPLWFSNQLYNNYEEKGENKEVVLIQPNIDPYKEKFNALSSTIQLEKILTLAGRSVNENTDYIVAPETAIPFVLWERNIHLSDEYIKIRDFIENDGLSFIIGAYTARAYEIEEEVPSTAEKIPGKEAWYDNFNTAIHVQQNDSVQLYHKSKLVAGVEIMPFPALFRPFQELFFNMGGITGSLGIQDNPAVFSSVKNNTEVAPVICYESVFGEFIKEKVKKGAQLIFILTNDGWWGDTPGYQQHKSYAKLRAIENRRSVARSANTGISCFINQRGEIIQSVGWWKEGAIKDTLKANTKLTFYTKHGDFIARISLFTGFLLILWSVVRSLINKKASNK